MSYATSYSSGLSGIGINVSGGTLANSSVANLASILNSNTSGSLITGNWNDSSYSRKMPPTFKLELFKSENGGFVMHLITTDKSTYVDKIKLFILNDLQNMGIDIQNILASEVLKY